MEQHELKDIIEYNLLYNLVLCVASRCIKDDELNLGQTLYELDVDEKGAPWLRAEQNDNLVIVLCDIIDIVIKYGNVVALLNWNYQDYIEKKNLLPVRKILMEREDMLKIRERLRKIYFTRLNPLRYFDDTYIQNPMFRFGRLDIKRLRQVKNIIANNIEKQGYSKTDSEPEKLRHVRKSVKQGINILTLHEDMEIIEELEKTLYARLSSPVELEIWQRCMKRYVQIIDELLKQPGDTITIYKRPHIWINRI